MREDPVASMEESVAPVTAVLPEDRGQFTARIRRELEGISQGGTLSEEKAYQAWQRVNTLRENLVQAFTRSSDSESLHH